MIEAEQQERDLVKVICDDIQKRKTHWEDQFKLMRAAQAFVRKGASKDWKGQRVNIAARHVRDWTSSLYARRPRTVFRRRQRMEFALWDESAASIQQATQTIAMANPDSYAMAAEAASMTGSPPPQMATPEEFAQATQMLQDAVDGLARRATYDKIGRTLTLAYDYFLDEQFYGSRHPMKRMIRRGFVSGVSYVRPAFQRVTGHSPDVARRLVDAKARLSEIERRAAAIDEGDMERTGPEALELQQMIEDLEAQPKVLIREGLGIYFPASTSIIPDEHMTDIMGFEGCEQVCEEFIMTQAAAEAAYGVKIDKFTPYNSAGQKKPKDDDEDGCVVIWQNWNIRTGLVHTVCDGFERLLTAEYTPPVYSEHFWPWLVFAPMPSEDPDNPWPISVIETIADPCMEVNRSIQGLSDVRFANRPGTMGTTQIDEKLKRMIESRKANDHIVMEGLSPDDLKNAILPFPSPPIDQNVYTIQPYINAIELATGVSEARFDASSRVSATAVSISEAGHTSNVNSIRDELDDLQSQLARMCSQILMREMSAQEIKRIVGPGAVWPETDMQSIAEELYLETEFGSSGLPNQAQRVASLRDLGQLLLEIPGVVPERLAKLLLEAIDQNIDLMDFFDQSILTSIRGMNQMMTGQGASSQGGGADNAPKVPGPESTEPAVTA